MSTEPRNHDRAPLRRASLATAAVAAASVLLSGCGLLSGGVYDTPLPGGADVGSDPITLTADFDDVLDLVPQSSVKVDDVAVGRVSKIALNPDGYSAKVTIVVNRDTELPAGTTARLEQTSLLGEKFVSLERPGDPADDAATGDDSQAGTAATSAPTGPPLKDGDEIPLADTTEAANVESVLGSLSLVLNGGGIQQFNEISRELRKVSEGRPEEIKQFLNQLQQFVETLDDRKESITDALDALASLSTTLNADKDKIVNALDGLEPGLAVIADQREQLVDMLEALQDLSDVTVKTLDASQDDIVGSLKALEPVVDNLAKAGSDLPNSLQILLTYPFPDSVLGAIKGDYMNAFISTTYTAGTCTVDSCEQPTDPNYPPGGDADLPGGAGVAAALAKPVSPSLLPPTSSPSPGIPTPTVPVPSSSTPTPDDPDPTPSDDPSPSTSPSASPSSSTSSTKPSTSGDGPKEGDD